jgi:hypothetical protein
MQQQATIVPDGAGFRCSSCGGGVRRDATSCKHCGLPFAAGVSVNAADLPANFTAPQAVYDKLDQLKQLEQVLLPGERIEAVFDCKGAGAGFIGITTKRIVFHDKQFLRKLKAIVSIPYSRIHSIATEDEAGLLTGRGFFASSKIHLATSHGEHEFEFRGADKAHTAHNLILGHMV